MSLGLLNISHIRRMGSHANGKASVMVFQRFSCQEAVGKSRNIIYHQRYEAKDFHKTIKKRRKEIINEKNSLFSSFLLERGLDQIEDAFAGVKWKLLCFVLFSCLFLFFSPLIYSLMFTLLFHSKFWVFVNSETIAE